MQAPTLGLAVCIPWGFLCDPVGNLTEMVEVPICSLRFLCVFQFRTLWCRALTSPRTYPTDMHVLLDLTSVSFPLDFGSKSGASRSRALMGAYVEPQFVTDRHHLQRPFRIVVQPAGMSGTSRASSPYPSSRATSAFPPTTVGSPEPEGSTAPSSPPPFADEDEVEEEEEPIDDKKWETLNSFLERVTVYAKVLKEQMDSVKHPRPAPAPASRTTRKRPRESASGGPSSKQMRHEDHEDIADGRNGQEEAAEKPATRFTQPVLVTGGKLKEYQLEGVAWMVGLFQNGISGILGECAHRMCSPKTNIRQRMRWD